MAWPLEICGEVVAAIAGAIGVGFVGGAVTEAAGAAGPPAAAIGEPHAPQNLKLLGTIVPQFEQAIIFGVSCAGAGFGSGFVSWDPQPRQNL